MGLPLQGKTILVTRAAGQSSQFCDRLQDQGATVVEMPALEIRPPSTWQPLDHAIAQLASYHWLILTSANGVNFFWDRVAAVGDAGAKAALAALPIAVVGKKTAQVLKQRGRDPTFVPPDFVADALVETFPESVAGKRLLFPRVESGGRDLLVQAMVAAGAVVTEVPAYESGCPPGPDQGAIAALAARQVQVITFASSKTVHHSCQLLAQGLGADWATYLAGVAIAAIGPQTADACRDRWGRVDIVANTYTLEGLTEAISQWASASSA